MAEIYRILHLESSTMDASLVSRKLEEDRINFEHLVVKNREGYLSALESFNPDVILADHEVSSFHCREALKEMRAFNKAIPFIVVTRPVSESFAVEMLKAGADDYLLKNQLQNLAQVIKQALEKHQSRKLCMECRDQLVANENKFRRLIEKGAEGVLLLTAEGKPSYVSPSVKRILGYSEDELSRLKTKEVVHPKDLKATSEYLTKCLDSPGVSIGSVTGRVRHRDGSWRWVEATFTNLLYDPDVKGIINNFKDVTEQKHREESIRESEEKYRSFFESSLDGILITKPDGRIFAANPAACEIFQMTEEEICRAGRAGLLDEDDPQVIAAVKMRERTGKASGVLTMKRKDGSKFPAELTSSVFTAADGDLCSSIIIRDISGRIEAEEELRNSREKYKLLFRFGPLPSLIYDQRTYRIMDVNDAAVNHYGYSRKEFLKMSVLDLRPKEEVAAFLSHLCNTVDQNETRRTGKSNHLKKDGTPMKVEVHSYRIDYQETDCRLAVCIDVTEKETAMQKLKDKRAKLLTAEKIAKLGYWELDPQTNAVFWTGEIYKIWERDPETYKPDWESLLKTIHPEDLERFKKEQEVAFSGEKELDTEHRIILPDGTIKWVHERGKLIKDEQGSPVVFEGTVQDVTDRNVALQKLRLSEARQRGILKSQTNYLSRTDLQGNYTYCNDKFVEDYGWIFPDQKVLGENAVTTVKEYHRKRVIEVFHKMLESPNTVYQVEIDKHQRDGGVRSTLWDFVCLTNSAGEPVEVQGVGIDITDRVKAEKALLESNTRYELVSRATSDAIWDWDLETGDFFWGEGFNTLFGHEPEAFSPTVTSWTDHIHPEDKLRVTREIYSVIEGTENKWEAEYRFRKSDETYAIVVDKGFIKRDENNKAVRMVGAMQDVTEKRKLEDLLNKATSLSRIGSFELDLTNNELFWSPMTKEIHEVGPDYTPELEAAINFYKEDGAKEIVRKKLEDVVKNNMPYDMELQIVTAKGNERWVRSIGRSEIVDGKCVRIAGSFQDIDKLKRAEINALKASEEKELILESIGDAFFAVNNDRIVTYFNKQAEKLLDCSKKEIVGRGVWEVFSDAVETPFYSFYQKAILENKIQNFEEYYKRVGRWFDVTAYPSAKGLSVYFRDVTERKKSEIKLVELNKSLKTYTSELVTANKGLEQFSYIVSHNLRSPVANIIGLADLIQQEDYPEQVREKLLQELTNNVKRLDTVIKDLNSILQVKVELNSRKESVNLLNLVHSIKSSIRDLIKKEQVQISTEFNEVPELNTIQSYLYSIFYNLIINSIKYRQSGVPPRLEIKSERIDDQIVLKFKDNGVGIDLDRKKGQIFGLYKRFHDHVEGKGLGLFMVKTQVEMLKGNISVSSEVNKGTEFIIAFKDDNKNLTTENEKRAALYGR